MIKVVSDSLPDTGHTVPSHNKEEGKNRMKGHETSRIQQPLPQLQTIHYFLTSIKYSSWDIQEHTHRNDKTIKVLQTHYLQSNWVREFSLRSLVYILQISGYQVLIKELIAFLFAHARVELLSPEITATCCFSWQITDIRNSFPGPGSSCSKAGTLQ